MHGKNGRVFIILSLRRTGDDLQMGMSASIKLQNSACRYRSSLFKVHCRRLKIPACNFSLMAIFLALVYREFPEI